MMDFKALVNKESFKTTLLQHLKHQIHAEFDRAVASRVREVVESDGSLSPDHVASAIATEIAETEAFPNFTNTFLRELSDLFVDRERYNPKQKESRGNASSMDFLNLNQLKSVTGLLSSGVNAEKLEALETFHHLPTQEHLIKQSFWPAIEAGLHDALASGVVFLQDASLKLYVKMLNSPEPKVVQESYSSLLKHLVQNLLPSLQLDDEFASRCRSILEIVSVVNKFLQNISSRWLRFPQTVIEEITVSSIRLLSCEGKFPVWMWFAVCDTHCEWLKNIMHGYVSRSFVIRTLEENAQVLKFSIKICEDFIEEENVATEACCQKSATVSEITHVVCFVSHLLQYSQSRRMMNGVCDEHSSSYWVYVLDLVMQCCRKFCEESCLGCSAPFRDVLSKKWRFFWLLEGLESIEDRLVGILTVNSDRLASIKFSNVLFDLECLCESFQSLVDSQQTLHSASKIHNFILLLLNYCTGFITVSDSEADSSIFQLFSLTLALVRKVLLNPCVLFINSNFIDSLRCWWLKMVDFSKSVCSADGKKIIKFLHEISEVHMCMLRKPICIMICQSTSLLETSLNILLEKMLKDIKSKNSVCFRDLSVISSALNYTYTLQHCLNKSIVSKLASIVWQFDQCDSESLSIVRSFVELLVPPIFSDLVLLEVSDDPELNPLFQCVLLFPSFIKSEFVCDETHTLLALHVISVLACSVQYCCILRAQFQLQNSLFDLLSNSATVAGETLVDPISVLSNHILIKLFTVGGDCERSLPPETLEAGDDYGWPFFTHHPVPESYYPSKFAAGEIVSESDCSSENPQDMFVHLLETQQHLSPQSIFELLRETHVVSDSPLATNMKLTSLGAASDSTVLPDVVLEGIDMTLKYGLVLNLVSGEDFKPMLETLIKNSTCLSGAEKGSRFDVFAATVFLMCKGDLGTSSKVMEAVSQSTISLYVRLELSLPEGELAKVRGVISEQCDLLVQQTLPVVFAALQSGGLLPSSLFCEWTSQCYWNYLNFAEVAHFVLLVVLFSGDFAIYFFASVLKHLSNVIVSNAQDAVRVLKRNSIRGFQTSSYLPFIMQLAEAFHNDITYAVKNVPHE